MKKQRSLAGFFLTGLLIVVIATFGIRAVMAVPELQTTDGEVYLPLVLRAETTPSPTATPVQPTPSSTVVPVEGTLIIDHTSIALYDRIPQQYLDAAENIRFTFMDRSVGGNINDGITCLSANTWADSASHCRRDYLDTTLTTWKTFTTNDSDIPDVILFPGGNDRDNIGFIEYAGDYWYDDIEYFIQQYPGLVNTTDIFTFQHNYLHVDTGSTIDDYYFDPNYNGYNIYDLLALESQYPNRNFVYWTSSLALTIGTADAQSFNDQMRAWSRSNGKILLDVADIESHNPDGSPCRSAQGYEVLCQRYTTEIDGGHLGSVSGGKIQIAKAIWVMLAQVAGWQP